LLCSFRLQLIVLILLELSAANSFGQAQSHVELDYRFGLLKAATHAPNVINQNYSGSGEGLSRENTFGIGYSRTITSVFQNNLNIDGKAGLFQSLGSFAASDGAFSLSHTATFLRFGADLSHSFPGTELGIGAWLDLPLSQSLTEAVTSQGTTRSDNSLLYSSIPFGLKLEIGLTDRVISSLPLYPRLFSEFDLGAYRQPEVSLGQAASIGIGLQWSFMSAMPDTITSIPISENSGRQLEAQVHFVYQGHPIRPGEKVLIEPQDTIFRQYAMLPSYLPNSYHHLTQEEATRFSIDSLARLSEDQLFAELPNLIGMRLKADAAQSILLKAKDSIAAHEITDYLQHIFSIPQNQVTLANREDRLEHVAIDPLSNSLLSPAVTQWIERSYLLREIGLEHSVKTGSANSWHITVEQQNGPVTTIADGHEGTLSLDGIRASNNSPIVATLYASDNFGSQITASDTLHLGLSGGDQTTAPTVTRFVLLADSSQMITVNRLCQKMHELLPAKQTSIDYFFDRSGFPGWLQTRIAQSGIAGRESSHTLDFDDVIGPRAIITIQK